MVPSGRRDLDTRAAHRPVDLQGIAPLLGLLGPMLAHIEGRSVLSRELAEAVVTTDVVLKGSAVARALRAAALEGPDLWALAELLHDKCQARAPAAWSCASTGPHPAARRLALRGVIESSAPEPGDVKLTQALLDACLRDAFAPTLGRHLRVTPLP